MIRVNNYQYSNSGTAQAGNVSFSTLSNIRLRDNTNEKSIARELRAEKLEKTAYVRGVLGGLIALASVIATLWDENSRDLLGLIPAVFLVSSFINLLYDAKKIRNGE